jgi:hypothetical protein
MRISFLETDFESDTVGSRLPNYCDSEVSTKVEELELKLLTVAEGE